MLVTGGGAAVAADEHQHRHERLSRRLLPAWPCVVALLLAALLLSPIDQRGPAEADVGAGPATTGEAEEREDSGVRRTRGDVVPPHVPYKGMSDVGQLLMWCPFSYMCVDGWTETDLSFEENLCHTLLNMARVNASRYHRERWLFRAHMPIQKSV